MYCRVKDLKEAYKDTGLNLAYVFDSGHPDKLDPIAAQWFIYWLRRQKDPAITLASVEGYEEGELAEAVTSFFLKPSMIEVPKPGSPTSTSPLDGSDGASQTSTTQG